MVAIEETFFIFGFLTSTLIYVLWINLDDYWVDLFPFSGFTVFLTVHQYVVESHLGH